MKHVLLCAALVMGGISVSPQAVSGPHGDALFKCIVSSATPANRRALVQWLVSALSQHPSMQGAISMPAKQREAYDQGAADLFQRLLTESCASQVRDTIRNEGTNAISAAFAQLGKMAGEEAFSDPAVSAGMQGMLNRLDEKKMQKAFSAKP
jgi:hypothetical protein